MATGDLTAERLRELLNYDADTGKFTWRVDRPGRFARAGKEAGTITIYGYRSICIGRPRMAHRLVFLYMTGEMPQDDVDHIDGNPLNNAWSNLRDVSHRANTQNIRKARRHNKSGLLGVATRHQKSGLAYFARIILPGGAQRIGTQRKTPTEAHEDYLAMKLLYHDGFVG